MTDNAPELARGDEYIVFYTGGPYDRQSDHRISTDGSWDAEVTVIAAVDGKETQLVYASPVVHKVGDQVQLKGYGLEGTLAGTLHVRSQPGREMRAAGRFPAAGPEWSTA